MRVREFAGRRRLRESCSGAGKLSSRRLLKEAVANMLVHRDLALRDQPTRLNIFDRTIELINPRRTVGFLSRGAEGNPLWIAGETESSNLCDFLESCLWSGFAHGWIANVPARIAPVLRKAQRDLRFQ